MRIKTDKKQVNHKELKVLWFICLSDLTKQNLYNLLVLQTDVIPDIEQKHDLYKPFVWSLW